MDVLLPLLLLPLLLRLCRLLRRGDTIDRLLLLDCAQLGDLAAGADIIVRATHEHEWVLW